MRHFISKKTIAMTMAGAMMVSNCAIAFGENTGSTTGNNSGAYEYDNSVTVEYDEVEVPVYYGGEYDFTFDPTGQLANYRPSVFSSDATVYFQSIASGAEAKVTAKKSIASGGTLYTKSYELVSGGEALWDEDVLNSNGELSSIKSIYYVWVPTDYADNSKGDYAKLTSSAIANYFEIDSSGTKKIKTKEEHFFVSGGTGVFDGNLYKEKYTELGSDGGYSFKKDVANDSLSDYVLISGGSISTISNLYLASGAEKIMASSADLKYTAATPSYTNQSRGVKLVNKSTKTKVITATVTMNSAADLTFDSDGTFGSGAGTSVYFAANNNSAYAMNSAGVLTYTAEIAPATALNSGAATEFTFMGSDGDLNSAGGHNYHRFTANGIKYNSDTFYIVAKANDNEDAEAAWNAYLATLNSANKPSLTVVYKVANSNAGVKVTFDADGGEFTSGGETTVVTTDAAGKVAVPSAPSKSGYTFGGWYTAKEGAGDAVTADKVYNSATTVYAKWTLADVAPSIATTSYTMEADKAINVAVNLGSGSKKATTVSSVMFGSANTLSNGYATYNDGVITFTAECVNNLLGRSASSYELTVKFNDSESTEVVITLNKP